MRGPASTSGSIWPGYPSARHNGVAWCSARSNIHARVKPSTDRVYVSKAKDDTVYVIDETLITPTP